MARAASTRPAVLGQGYTDSTKHSGDCSPDDASSPRRIESPDTLSSFPVSSFPISSPIRSIRLSFDTDVLSSPSPTSSQRRHPFTVKSSPTRRCCSSSVVKSHPGPISPLVEPNEFENELIVQEKRHEDLANDIHEEYQAMILRKAQRRSVMHEITARRP